MGGGTQEARDERKQGVSGEMPTEHRKQMVVKVISKKNNCFVLLF